MIRDYPPPRFKFLIDTLFCVVNSTKKLKKRGGAALTHPLGPLKPILISKPGYFFLLTASLQAAVFYFYVQGDHVFLFPLKASQLYIYRKEPNFGPSSIIYISITGIRRLIIYLFTAKYESESNWYSKCTLIWLIGIVWYRGV